jgi:hypothetical protein
MSSCDGRLRMISFLHILHDSQERWVTHARDATYRMVPVSGD